MWQESIVYWLVNHVMYQEVYRSNSISLFKLFKIDLQRNGFKKFKIKLSYFERLALSTKDFVHMLNAYTAFLSIQLTNDETLVYTP